MGIQVEMPACWCTQAGLPGKQEIVPMTDTELNQYEGTDKRLIEDINQLKNVALGEGAAACQVCDSELSGGAPVTVFAYRPAGRPTYELAYVSCGESEHDLPTYFTLGVRDLLVDGRIGRCVDPTTDSSWPVLLNPSVRAVSPMDSTTARIAPTELPTSPLTESSTDSPTAPTTDEVSWVYGDALLKRASENAPHSAPTDGTRETNAEDEHTATENPPNSDGDSLGEDRNHANNDGDAPTPADTDADVATSATDDADGSGDGSLDGTGGDVSGGEW